MTLGLDDLGGPPLGDGEFDAQTIVAPQVHCAASIEGDEVYVNGWVTDSEGAIVIVTFDYTVWLYAQNGALISGPHVVEVPDVRGVFALSFSAPAVAVGRTLMYFRAQANIDADTVVSVTGAALVRVT